MAAVVRFLLLAAALAANPSLRAGDREPLTITSVTPELQAAVLLIEGSNLNAAGAATVVQLSGIANPLNVVKADPQRIVAQLPANIPWANYLVKVSCGSESHQVSVDIGIVGPVVQDN